MHVPERLVPTHIPRRLDAALAPASHVAPPPPVRPLVPYQATQMVPASSRALVPHGGHASPHVGGTGTGTGTGAVAALPVLGVAGKGAMTVYDAKHVILTNSMTKLTADDFRVKKAEQRSSQNYWKAEYAFPTGDVYERDSLVAARDFVCFGMQGCKIGDCCRLLETSDISDLRREAAVRAAALKERTDGGHKGALLDVVQSDLQPYWDGSHFSMVNCRLSVSTQVQICASAYALAVGLTGSSAQKVFQRIKDDVPLSMPVAPEERRWRNRRRRTRRPPRRRSWRRRRRRRRMRMRWWRRPWLLRATR